MNALQEAVSRVRHVVPLQILEDAFIDPRHRGFGLPVSLDEQILNKVIRSRVMADCSLIGGTEITVPLDGLKTDSYDAGRLSVYIIPKSHTQGRNIINPLNIQFSRIAGAAASGAQFQSSQMLQTARGMLSSNQPPPITSTARVRLIAENTILVENSGIIQPNSFLRCIVEHDENLSGIQPSSFHTFFQLVEYAVKAYIYNKLILNIGQARLSGGQELGVYRDIVDSYSDANELYTEFLRENWAETSLLNDDDSKRRAINILLPIHV